VDKRSGILVSAGHARELASAIGALADDPLRRTAMAAHARRRTANSFKWSDAALRALAGYEGVLRRARQREMRDTTVAHQAT
jgi:glycosyltransferase involved in cell wall biosynthesis